MSRYAKDSSGNWHLVAGGLNEDTHFIGTSSQWDELSTADKAKYVSRDIIDDYNGNVIDSTPTKNSANLVSSGGTYSAISDSMKGDCIIIAASYGTTPSTSVNFVTKLKPLLETSYTNVYDSSQGGAGFYNGVYLSLIQGLSSTIIRKDRVKTILTVCIGNDIGYTWSDVLNAMITYRAYCNSNYPNAQVIVVPVSSRYDPTSVNNLYTLYNNMCNTVKTHRMTIMRKLYHILALNYTTYTGSDNIHPSEVGAELIAEAIYSNLCGSDFAFNYQIGMALADADNPDITASSVIGGIIKNIDNVYIYLNITFTVSSNISVDINWNNQTPLIKVSEIRTPSNYVHLKFMGILYDLTDNTEVSVRVGSEYNSTLGDYYLGIIRNTGSLTLVPGHNYRVRAMYSIPFEYV